MPPFVTTAVNNTFSPAQIVSEGEAEIVTDAATVDETAIVIALEVAGDPVMHGSLPVMIHVIISASARVVEVYVELVAPEISDPLSCH